MGGWYEWPEDAISWTKAEWELVVIVPWASHSVPSPWRHNKHMKSCVRDEWEGKDGNKCNSLEYWEAKKMKGSIKPPVLPGGGRWVRSPDVLRVTPGVSWPLSGKFKLAKVQPCPSSTVIYLPISSSFPTLLSHWFRITRRLFTFLGATSFITTLPARACILHSTHVNHLLILRRSLVRCH